MGHMMQMSFWHDLELSPKVITVVTMLCYVQCWRWSRTANCSATENPARPGSPGNLPLFWSLWISAVTWLPPPVALAQGMKMGLGYSHIFFWLPEGHRTLLASWPHLGTFLYFLSSLCFSLILVWCYLASLIKTLFCSQKNKIWSRKNVKLKKKKEKRKEKEKKKHI